MKKSGVSIGPGAASLILIILVVSMTVLGMLSMMSSRTDDRLSARAVRVAEKTYGLNGRSERSFMLADSAVSEAIRNSTDEESFFTALEGLLPENMELDGDEISWTEEASLSSSDIAGTLLHAVTGKNLSDGRRMFCSVRVSYEDRIADPAKGIVWVYHVPAAE